MTIVKLEAKVATHAADALGLHVDALYANLGRRIAELAAVERNEIAADEDKDAYVKLQVKHLEVAADRAEEPVRDALRALHAQRTAFGTLNEDQEVELSDETLARLGGELNAVEAARLHVLVDEWARYAKQAANASSLTATELRHEPGIVADALRAGVYPTTVGA